MPARPELPELDPVDVYSWDIRPLKLAEIEIAAYQRRTSNRRGDRLAQNFDENALDLLLVSDRDGSYWCVDGAHRKVMFTRLGLTEIPCRVVHGLTYEEEAELFRKRNDRRNAKPVTAAENFHAGLESGNATVTAVYAGIRAAGLVMPRDINCHRALLSAYEDHGALVFRRAMQVLRGVLEGTSIQQVPNWLVQGVSLFLAKSEGIDDNRLIRQISRYYLAIDSDRRAGRSWGTGGRSWARIIQAYYYKGLSGRRVKAEF